MLIQQSSSRGRALQILVMALCAVAIAAAQGLDSKQLRLTSKDHWYSGELKVGVRQADVTLGRLLTTARAVQDRTKAMGVHFFLDPRAAEAFRFIGPEPHPGDYEAARYYLAGYTRVGRESLTIAPFGFAGPSNEVTLDADLPRMLRCHYELDRRCLLGLKPLGSDLTDLTGTVTLTAMLTSRGVLSGARVVEANAQDESRRSRLTELAQRNVPSWWLDPSDRQVVVRITYAVGPSAISPTGVELDLEYPRSLTEADLVRLSPAARALTSTEHRKSHFRVTASVVPQ